LDTSRAAFGASRERFETAAVLQVTNASVEPAPVASMTTVAVPSTAIGRILGPPGQQLVDRLALGALRLAGFTNIAAALRHNNRDPTRPLTVLSIPCP
jgi:hypothetical protein